MRLGVIGAAGLLGSTTAFYAGLTGAVSEIKLIDVKENVVQSHVMDMDQALSALSRTRVSKASYSDLADCDIILITASLPERSVGNRNEYLQGNLSLMRDICGQIKANCSDKIIVCATNPVDVFNFAAWKLLGWPREKMIGFCLNDSVRFRWAIANIRNVPASEVDALCVGEHGDAQVPLFSQVSIGGQRASLSDDEKTAVGDILRNWFGAYQALQSGRTTGWTSALSLGRMIAAIASGSGECLPVSAILDGEYGQSHVSVGVPVQLGRNGIEAIHAIAMSDHEEKQFAHASNKIRSMIDSIGL